MRVRLLGCFNTSPATSTPPTAHRIWKQLPVCPRHLLSRTTRRLRDLCHAVSALQHSFEHGEVLPRLEFARARLERAEAVAEAARGLDLGALAVDHAVVQLEEHVVDEQHLPAFDQERGRGRAFSLHTHLLT